MHFLLKFDRNSYYHCPNESSSKPSKKAPPSNSKPLRKLIQTPNIKASTPQAQISDIRYGTSNLVMYSRKNYDFAMTLFLYRTIF